MYQTTEENNILLKNSLLFRLLRNTINYELHKNFIGDLCSVSWPTVQNSSIALKKLGVLQNSIDSNMPINPNYAHFAGVYITENSMDIALVDFQGNTIKKRSYKPLKDENMHSLIFRILKNFDYSNLKGLSISSDNNYNDSIERRLETFIPHKIGINMEQFQEACKIPTEHFCFKAIPTNIANCIAQEEFECKSAKSLESALELNKKTIVVISYNNNEVFSTTIYNGKVIEKSANLTNCFESNTGRISNEEFIEKFVAPSLRLFSPDKFVFFSNNEKTLNWMEKNLNDWKLLILSHKAKIYPFTIPSLAINKTTPAESTALHSMYAYYGWEF